MACGYCKKRRLIAMRVEASRQRGVLHGQRDKFGLKLPINKVMPGRQRFFPGSVHIATVRFSSGVERQRQFCAPT